VFGWKLNLHRIDAISVSIVLLMIFLSHKSEPKFYLLFIFFEDRSLFSMVMIDQCLIPD
jgi:hypothetical protein